MPNLNLPTPGVTPGPEWAARINSAFGIINGELDGRLSPEGLEDSIAAAAAELNPQALSDTFIGQQIANPSSQTSTQLNNFLSPLKPNNGATRAVGKDELIFNVKDFAFSTVGTGGNDTTAFQQTIAKAAVKGGDVLVPCGTYIAEGLVLPNFVRLIGQGGHSRFSTGTLPGGGRAASRIIRPGAFSGNTSTETMVTLQGAASGIIGLSLEGKGAPGTILVAQGFETELHSVRIISGGGIGFDIQKANNVKWGWIYVDNCGGGTAETPAVKIWSKEGTGSANETNTLEIVSLRIERSNGTALSVADGTTGEYWVEWLKILFLHIENPRNEFETYATALPQVFFGNVRSVEILMFMLYGGTGELIRHNQRFNRSLEGRVTGNGEIRIGYGWFLGYDTTPTQTPGGQASDPALPGTTVAIQLIAGTGFYVDRAVVRRIGTQVVSAQTAYGTYSINVTSSSVRVQPPPTVTPITAAGVSSATILTGTAVGNAVSDDKVGRVFWSTGASPVAGEQVRVNLYHPDSVERIVLATPKNDATAKAGIYTSFDSSKQYFSIRAATPAANSSYQADYYLHPIQTLA